MTMKSIKRITYHTFKVCKSVHHRTVQRNHQPDATIFQFIILTFIYSWTCFGRFPAHHQELNDYSGSLWFYLRIVVTAVLCSWSGRPARPRTHCHNSDMFRSILIIFRELLNINTACIRKLVLLMFSKSLKIFKIDWNISELRQMAKEIYNFNISAFVDFTV
jgi:hypothetical protein